MLGTTDIQSVKAVAKWLLWTDVHKTPYSPIIVQHPFTSSGLTVIGGASEIIDITQSKQNLQRWREFMGKKIDRADGLMAVYIMLNKTYVLTFLKFAKQYLSKKDLSEILADAWTRSETPNMDANVTKQELVEIFEQSDKAALMTAEERKRLSELDENITVYRGVTSYNAKNVKALSWTTDIKKAEWFAHRFNEAGTIYKAEINKDKVLAYFTCRGESEIIVNPKHLKNLQAMQ